MKLQISFEPTKEETHCFMYCTHLHTKSFFKPNENTTFQHVHIKSGENIIASTKLSLGVPILDNDFLDDVMDHYELKLEFDIQHIDGKFSLKTKKTKFTREDMIHALTYGHSNGRAGISHEKTLEMYREDHL